MTDQELLEAAARVAGIEVIRSRLDDPMNRDFLVLGGVRNPHQKSGPWNPLTDDGDALRLAVKLGMHIQPSETDAWVTHLAVTAIEPLGADPYAATRRAIVRAAAEIGKKP